MKRVLAVLAMMSFLVSAGLADQFPVTGATQGTWPNTGGNVWVYATNGYNTSDVEFDGTSFGGVTPYNNVYLGKLELNNGVPFDPNKTYTNTLTFQVNFTTPGGDLSFLFPLLVQTRMILGDVLIDLPTGGSQSMTFGGETYTLTLDGFFDCLGNKTTKMTSIIGTTVSANLYGDFTSTHVPEPGAIVLLAIFLSAVWIVRSALTESHWRTR
jgi:hypothetical protein